MPCPRSLTPRVPATVGSVPPSPTSSRPRGGPAAPRHRHVRGTSLPGRGYQDAAPLEAVPAPGWQGQLPGRLFNPVCSNLAISERESRAQAD